MPIGNGLMRCFDVEYFPRTWFDGADFLHDSLFSLDRNTQPPFYKGQKYN